MLTIMNILEIPLDGYLIATIEIEAERVSDDESRYYPYQQIPDVWDFSGRVLFYTLSEEERENGFGGLSEIFGAEINEEKLLEQAFRKVLAE